MFVNKEILGVDSSDYDSAIYFSGQKRPIESITIPLHCKNGLVN